MPSLVKVIAINPDSHSVDVEMTDGRRIFGVSVISPSASANSGQNNLPALDGDNSVVAILDYFEGEIPFIMGFLFPQVAQNLFTDNRALNRHHSGVYTTITDSGEIEVFHPGGAFVRMGELDSHEDLTKKDYDQLFNNRTHAGNPVCITVGFVGKPLKIKITDAGIAITGDLSLDGKLTMSGALHTNSGITADDDILAGDVSLKHHTHPGTMQPD